MEGGVICYCGNDGEFCVFVFLLLGLVELKVLRENLDVFLLVVDVFIINMFIVFESVFEF